MVRTRMPGGVGPTGLIHGPGKPCSSTEPARLRRRAHRGLSRKRATRPPFARSCDATTGGSSGSPGPVVRDAGEAEDVVQEAYRKAFAGLASFRGEALLSTCSSPRHHPERGPATTAAAAPDDRAWRIGSCVKFRGRTFWSSRCLGPTTLKPLPRSRPAASIRSPGP